MRALRFPFPALARLWALSLCAALLWPSQLLPGGRQANATVAGESARHTDQAAPIPAKPGQGRQPRAPQTSGKAAAEKAAPRFALRLKPITEAAMRRIPASLPWAAAYAHARATAWLTAVRRAAASLPPRREIRMGAETPEQRLALAAQLYSAAASSPGAKKADSLQAMVTLEPRPRPEQQIRVALRHAELLELRRRLTAETRATLNSMNCRWPGGSPDAPSAPAKPKGLSACTDAAWTSADWTRMGQRLDGLWLAQAALEPAPGGWLTAPGSLAVLEKAARLAPDSPIVRLLLAEAQLQSGLPQQCVESCNEALRLDPSLGRARYIRGLAHWRLQQLALAEDDLSSALAAGSKPPSRGIERARLLRARGAVRLLRRNYDGMCEDFASACALGDCEGLAVARAQNYCRAADATEDMGSRSRPPAVLPPAFLPSPRDLPGPPAPEPGL